MGILLISPTCLFTVGLRQSTIYPQSLAFMNPNKYSLVNFCWMLNTQGPPLSKEYLFSICRKLTPLEPDAE
ncbi:Uncharacterised protein [Vibrio cholerae]|nr:Uncharacterised protein [Vibrio cholerae]CSC54497.1 Uncharacterised protein [Vibrio cholerae]